MADVYWISFRIHEPGYSYVVRGPFNTREEAMLAREVMRNSAALNEHVGIPFIASSEKEALERAHLF